MGWPFRIHIQDVHTFFQPFRLRDQDIDFEYQRDGRLAIKFHNVFRFSGTIFVNFFNESDASQAFATKNKQYAGKRFVELMPVDN